MHLERIAPAHAAGLRAALAARSGRAIAATGQADASRAGATASGSSMQKVVPCPSLLS